MKRLLPLLVLIASCAAQADETAIRKNLAENYLIALGDKLGIEATPTLIFSNGKRTEGALPAAEIERLLTSGS